MARKRSFVTRGSALPGRRCQQRFPGFAHLPKSYSACASSSSKRMTTSSVSPEVFRNRYTPLSAGCRVLRHGSARV